MWMTENIKIASKHHSSHESSHFNERKELQVDVCVPNYAEVIQNY